MINFYFIGRIAFYEARLLLRSWGFRIFSVLGLFFLAVLNVAIATPAFYTPHFMSSLSGSLPLNSLKLFNVFQGIIVAFLATEFFKRDRRHDSIQVVFARSFTNVDYYLGKALGIFSVFVLLNLAVLLLTFIIHIFFSSTPFVLQPYLLYTLLICLPTVIFMTGLSFFLSSLLRNQSVVFVLLLAYSFLILIFLGTPLFGLFDAYAFYLPLMYSDFIGLGNIGSILQVRLAYLFLGLSLVCASPLLFKRLRQSVLSNFVTGFLSIVCLVLALILGFSYTTGKFADREYRQQLKASSQEIVDAPILTVSDYNIQLEHQEKTILASVDMKMRNSSSSSLDSLWMTLNPGLEVHSVTWEGSPLSFQQEKHLIQITPRSTVVPGDSIDLSITYSGQIDERYCFLDIDDRRIESQYRLWIYDIPKHYALVTSGFVHLTPECGWYPIAGLSPGKAFPAAAAPQYATYTLSVLCSEDLTAISQGNRETQSLNGRTQHTFKPETKLPQISLTMGPYALKQIQVDEVLYALYFLPEHDYYAPYLDEISDDLPDLIRTLKDEYEVILGLDYPYKRLSLVEVPIHIYSYQRLWTVAFETVQPELVFLPEMGTICANADFEAQSRLMKKYNKKNVTPTQLQSYYFNNFVRTNLLNAATDQMGYIKGEGMAVTFQSDIEPQFELFPNFFSYTTYFPSSQWPVLNFAFESYIRERFAPPQTMAWRGGQALSREEEINLYLMDQSLSEMMDNSALDASIIHGALQAKGRMLLAQLEAQSSDSDFSYWLTDFFKQNKFRSVSQTDLSVFLSVYFDVNLLEIMDPWYSDNSIPGYIIGDVDSYDVINREKTWTQLKFQVANPTPVDGVARIDLRYRSQMKDLKNSGQGQSDYSKALRVPAKTTIDLGISIDQPPALMTIDTYVSQNIPSTVDVLFLGERAVKEEDPFDVEISKPYDRSDFYPEDEYIVDNTDEGFHILSTAKQSWLSRSIQKLSGSNKAGKESSYAGMNVYNPPAFWSLSANQEFYGSMVRSAYLKRAGDGEQKVAWNVRLEEPGSYDLYFYNGISLAMQKGLAEKQMRASPRNQAKSNTSTGSKGRLNLGYGKKVFLIPHQYGTDEVTIDLENAESGWSFIGSFQLDVGPNRIEQTDKSDTSYVLADAVKWIKRD